MSKLVAALALFCCLSPVFADVEFDKGVNFYHQKNYPQALKVFKSLAEQNHAEAQFNLGAMYQNGFGIEQDIKNAIAWYKKSAGNNYVEAMFNLGSIYQNGIGVNKSPDKAIFWYEKAANQGNEKAQAILKKFLESGNNTLN